MFFDQYTFSPHSSTSIPFSAWEPRRCFWFATAVIFAIVFICGFDLRPLHFIAAFSCLVRSALSSHFVFTLSRLSLRRQTFLSYRCLLHSSRCICPWPIVWFREKSNGVHSLPEACGSPIRRRMFSLVGSAHHPMAALVGGAKSLHRDFGCSRVSRQRHGQAGMFFLCADEFICGAHRLA